MKDIKSKIEAAIGHFRSELDAIRTGRANPAVVEQLVVECYGSKMPLVQVATITVPEPRLLIIQPWDVALIKDIEKAINQSSLGIVPVVDGKAIRLPFPQMNEERRKQLTKMVSERAEQAKISIRSVREEQMKNIKKDVSEGAVSEDVSEQEKKKLQEIVDQANVEVEEIVTRKNQEIMEV